MSLSERSPYHTERDGYVVAHWFDQPVAQVVGATNSKAEYPAERPLYPQDLLSTIDHHLGINHRHEFPDFSGRPIPVLPYGEPIRELV